MMPYLTKKIGEVCELYQPKTISKTEMVTNGQYKVYGANGVIGRYDKYNHEQSEILVTCRGATCGTVNVSEPKSWINGNAMVVHPKSEKEISKEYLYYLLRGGIDISTTISGSAQPQITRTTLYPIKIPLPPIGEQKKIVAKLERVLAKISEAKKLRAEARENADNLLPAELHKIFEEGKKKGWEEKSIQEVTKVVTKGTTPKTLGHAFTESGVPFLKAENVNGGATDASSTRTFISKQTHNLLSRSKTKSGDVLMTIAGTIGRLGWIPEDAPEMNMNQAVAIIRPRRDAISTQYLAYVLSAGISQGQVITGTVKAAIPNFSLGMIKKIKIPLPPLAEQKRIVKHLDSLSQKLQKLQEYQKSTRSDLLTFEQAILRKAFSPSPAP